MAYWKPTKGSNITISHHFGDGINTFTDPFNIKDGELTDASNVACNEYPSISVRNGNTIYNTTDLGATPLAMGLRGNTVHVKDNNTWKYLQSVSSAIQLSTSLSASRGEFVTFTNGANLYTILASSGSTNTYAFNGTTSLQILSGSPATRLITVANNRLFMLLDKTLYFSALNNIFDWTTINDSGSIQIPGMKSSGTGICAFNDNVYCFTDGGMYVLYGTGPDDFKIVNLSDSIGCISHRSIKEINGVLYWLDYEGVYSYSGGEIKKLSNPVKRYIDGISLTNKEIICAGIKDSNYYLCVPYGSGLTANNTILIYNTSLSKWYIHQASFEAFANNEKILYAQYTEGQIYKVGTTSLNDNSSAISWDFETKAFGNNTETSVKDMFVTYKPGSTDATLNLAYSSNAYSTNSTNFNTIAQTTDFTASGTFSTDVQQTRIILKTTDLSNLKWYRLRFFGTGPMTVYKLEQNTRVKPR